MQRWIPFLLGAAVIALATILMVKGLSSQKAPPPWDAGAKLDAGTSSDASDFADVDLLTDFPTLPAIPVDGGVGYTMPDGTPVPPLGPGAPRQVRVGGILILYAGAEAAPKGTRTKAAAKELADKLDAEAKGDFHAAVQRGDTGYSFDEIGIIYRGSLEPAVEYAVFSLQAGDVSDVIDTPRGYWIVKRIE
jgi:hypothetical protein